MKEVQEVEWVLPGPREDSSDEFLMMRSHCILSQKKDGDIQQAIQYRNIP